jgi:hypothetical protein
MPMVGAHPSLEKLMRTSLFSLLVFSPSTLGHDQPSLKEAEDLTRAAEQPADINDIPSDVGF